MAMVGCKLSLYIAGQHSRLYMLDIQAGATGREASGSGGAGFDPAADFAPYDSDASLRMDALDGTAGLTGPRTWTGARAQHLSFNVSVSVSCTALQAVLKPSLLRQHCA